MTSAEPRRHESPSSKDSGTSEAIVATSAWSALLDTSQLKWTLMYHFPLAGLGWREKGQVFPIYEKNAVGQKAALL